VLVADLDPQAHATLGLGHDAEERPCALEVLAGRCTAQEALVRAAGGVALLPSHARLAEFEELGAQRLASERALRGALARLSGSFDFALVDCPPRADGLLAGNALAASTTAVLVIETGAFALQGALRALAAITETARAQGSSFEVRALATMFDRRRRLARELLVALQARFGPDLYETVIRASERLREAAAAGVPIQLLAPRCAAASDFAGLAEEIARARRPGRDLAASLALP
jgi:chromosome partitioning protein